jgi:uncharacterized protein DUF4287
MSAVDKAIQTQLTNIQTRTGKTLDELRAVLQQSGLTKHSEIRAMFQRDLGLGYGDANTDWCRSSGLPDDPSAHAHTTVFDTNEPFS